MTQQEAEGIIAILKRRKSEEVASIEQMYEQEHQKLEADRSHSVKRVSGHIKDYQKRLVEAKDDMFKARGKENWKEKALAVKTVSAALMEYQHELAELNRYYRDQLHKNRDRRDNSLRKLNTKYSEERARVMDKIEYPHREDQVKYWKAKYYHLKNEMAKLKVSA